ncbi:hypothetical protein ACFL4T_04320 [candidate division KSB1 bacterium]
MRKIPLLIFLFASVFISNCTKISTDIDENRNYGTVHGSVVLDIVKKINTNINLSYSLDNVSGLKVSLVTGGVPEKTTYTENGRYTFDDVEPGFYTLRIVITASFYIEYEETEITVGSPVTLQAVTIDRYGDTRVGGKYLTYYFDNPASASGLTIYFDKPDLSPAQWKVHTLPGTVIRTLSGEYNPNNSLRSHQVMWNLKDDDAAFCPAGVYFLITTDTFVEDLYLM